MAGELLLIPIGPLPPDLLPWLGEELHARFGRPWTSGPAMALPPEAYDAGRRQYRSDDLLERLRAFTEKAWRLLALVEADLYTPGLNFVFGQASLHGREALVALARLHPAFYSQPEDVERFHLRVLKEAVHELGHTLGLGHCPDRRCVMHFSNTLADTDFKGADFCPRCVRQVDRPPSQ